MNEPSILTSCNSCKEKTNHKIIAQKVAKNGRSYLVRKCEKCQKNSVRFIKKSLPCLDLENHFVSQVGGELVITPLPPTCETPQDVSPRDGVILGALVSGEGLKLKDVLNKLNLKNTKFIIQKANGKTYLNFTIAELENILHRMRIQGGILGIDDALISLIVTIIGLIVALVTITNDQLQRAHEADMYKKEQARRDRELKASEDKQKEQELLLKLKAYDAELGQMAAQANMSVKELCIVQLKDNQSKVTSMKNSLLKDAPKFNKTELEFVNYCIELAENYLWWNVKDLLELMKAELIQPGSISDAGEAINQTEAINQGLHSQARTKEEIQGKDFILHSQAVSSNTP